MNKSVTAIPASLNKCELDNLEGLIDVLESWAEEHYLDKDIRFCGVMRALRRMHARMTPQRFDTLAEAKASLRIVRNEHGQPVNDTELHELHGVMKAQPR